MYYDALTLAAVAGELRSTLQGGRIQDVIQVDRLSLGLEVYAHRRRHYLLFSAHPEYARLHLCPDKLRRGPDAPLPLTLLLRKHALGALIGPIEQPSLERVLRLELDHPEHGATTLVIEIMGRYSNIILLEPGDVIMDSIKRVGPEVNRYRVILPGRSYVPPPPQKKLSPGQATGRALNDALIAVPPDFPLWRFLVERVAGVSPLLAREAVFRATGKVNAPVGSALAESLRELNALWQLPVTGAWQPTVSRRGDEITAFAVYPLTHLSNVEPVTSPSEAVYCYFASVLSRDPYAEARRAVSDLLAAAWGRLENRRQALNRSLIPEDEIERLRESGEWLLAYATQIQPGQRELRLEREASQPLIITLDPAETPVENAQRYFREYRKSRRAAEEVPKLLQQLELEAQYLAQLETDLRLATNRSEIEEVRAALVEAGYTEIASSHTRLPRSQPLTIHTKNGLIIQVGRNSRQNADLLARAHPEDLWLHARSVPGGHVIIQSHGQSVPEAVVEAAAALAAYQSTARDEALVAVDVTERRYVRPIKGARPGLVTYHRERTLRVTPRPPETLEI